MTLRTTLFTLVGSLLVTLPLLGDPAVDALFDTTYIHDVRITMSPADWDRLRATFQESTNYDATLTIDGETVPDSSIRSRGSGTRNGVKPGLRVDFQRKIKSQRFRGFKVLVLDNMYNDLSFVREQLAFSVFREAGILVPREAFARLTVNGEYWGLYAIVEPIDEIFVTRHVDSGKGNLFEYNVPATQPGQLLAWDFSLSRGETVDDYVPEPLEPKTNEDDLDGTALIAFLRTISEAPDEAFVEEIRAFVDPEELLTYYAIEIATAEVDGLTSPFGVNNFYLYQLDGTTRFQFLPWDHDFNFTSPTHSIWYGMHRNQLIRRLLEDAEMKAFYIETLQSVMTTFMNPGWMLPRLDAMVNLIRDDVDADTKWRGGQEPATATQTFEDALAQVRQVVMERGASVDEQLEPPVRRRPSRR